MTEIKKRSIVEQVEEFIKSDAQEVLYTSHKKIKQKSLYNSINKIRRALGLEDFTCRVLDVRGNKCRIVKKQKHSR